MNLIVWLCLFPICWSLCNFIDALRYTIIGVEVDNKSTYAIAVGIDVLIFFVIYFTVAFHLA